MLLLKHVLEQELEDRAMGQAPRISFFLVSPFPWLLYQHPLTFLQVDSITLVFQQFAVLECNLDQPMARFCGNMNSDLWNKSLWEKTVAENMVIVCTAGVLHQCLLHSFVTMENINLLIFDEAHHAKKNHVYARIVKDFYIDVHASRRPKIFGMTASPVDARVDVKKAAEELEGLLHCNIATAADLSLLQYMTTSKKEELAEYEPLRAPFETELYKKLKPLLTGIEALTKPLQFAKEAASDLCTWCADQVWEDCFTDEEMTKLEAKIEREFHAAKVAEPLEVLEARITRLREAKHIVNAHQFRKPKAILEDLSSKVLLLHNILHGRFEMPTNDKCIVFVKQRYAARLLADLFSHENLGVKYLYSGTLVSLPNFIVPRFPYLNIPIMTTLSD